MQRQKTTQAANFERQPSIQRQEQYFREKIATVSTADQLVADRRLLEVALGAFGLGADVNSKFLIRKVLEEGTLKEGALALRFSDLRYREMSAAFGFGDYATPSTGLSGFADKILTAWKERSFEEAVGEASEPLRLAMNAQRELKKIAANPTSSDVTKWYSVLGQPPLRKVFEMAFNLPVAFGALGLERQIQILGEKSRALLGDASPAQFASGDAMDKLLRRFVVQSDLANGGALALSGVRGSAALALLTRAAG